MPSTPRNRRSGAGPGRGKPRSRTVSRPEAVSRSQVETTEQPKVQRTNTSSWLTRRAVAFFAVLAILVISYANSLRVYLDTSRENAENRAKIAAGQAHLQELNEELQRWDDPDFVRAQARDRLGWVVPGETGYRVIGVDGKPVGAGIDSEHHAAPTDHKATWWEKLGGSIDAADVPLPAAPDKKGVVPPTPTPTASPAPPITDGSNTPKPKKSPTPSKTTTKKAQ